MNKKKRNKLIYLFFAIGFAIGLYFFTKSNYGDWWITFWIIGMIVFGIIIRTIIGIYKWINH